MLENMFALVFGVSIAVLVLAVLIIFFKRFFGNKLPRNFKYALWAIVLLSFVLLIISLNRGTGSKSQGDGNLSAVSINESSLNEMLKYRSRYIGDASNVGNLLSKLPYGNRQGGISLKTDSRPYGITINYKLEDVNKAENLKPVLIDNALILFSLIENVETVNFSIHSSNQYEFQFTRAQMQEYFDKDLWSYSSDTRSFSEFLMDISFEVLVYPGRYSPLMSSVPGMRIDVSLNAAFYNFDFSTRYTTENGTLHTWEAGRVSEPNKTISLSHEPVYWSPLNMKNNEKEDTVTISIMDKDGNKVIEKRITITNGDGFYSVLPSHDVLTDDYYGLEGS